MDSQAVGHLSALVTAVQSKIQVGGITVNPSLGLSVDTNIYASGDVIDGVKSISDSVRGNTLSGIIESVVLSDGDNKKSEMDIYFFTDNPNGGTVTDNDPWAPSEDDIKKFIGKASVVTGNWETVGTEALAFVNELSIPFKLDSTNTAKNLYAIVVSRGTPTYTAATKLQVRVGILQD